MEFVTADHSMMKASSAFRALASGIAVYVGMAACSAASDVPTNGRGSGGDEAGGGGRGGETASSSSGLIDGALARISDALTDPVPRARAAESFEEPCNVPFNNDPQGTDFLAKHTFPGASLAELGTVRVLIATDSQLGATPITHTVITTQQVIDARTSTVLVRCTTGFQSVIFVR